MSYCGTTGGTALPSIYQLVPNANAAYNTNVPIFAYEWLNFSLYFPQYTFYGGVFTDAGRSRLLTSDNRHIDLSVDNKELIAGTLKNTVNLGRSDIHPTAFIEVPKDDIINIINRTIDGSTPFGFRDNQSPYTTYPLIGTDYKKSITTGSTYFYKGRGDSADIFAFLRKNNIV